MRVAGADEKEIDPDTFYLPFCISFPMYTSSSIVYY